MSVTYEEVLQHLLEAHGEHLRTTTDPLSLGDFVTVNYVNPLYARAKDRPQPIRFVDAGSGEVEVRLRLGVSLKGTTVQDFKRELRFTLEDAYGTGTVRELETQPPIEDESGGHH